MRTGFIRADPESFPADYSELLSNILFETQLSNCAKWDFDEAYYADILNDISRAPWNSPFPERAPDPLPSITFVQK